MSWATVQCERSKLRHVQLCSSQSALDRNTKKNPKRMLLYGRQCCMWVQTDTAEERHDQQRPAVDGVFFFFRDKSQKVKLLAETSARSRCEANRRFQPSCQQDQLLCRMVSALSPPLFHLVHSTPYILGWAAFSHVPHPTALH